MDLQHVDAIIDKYHGDKSWLVMILQDVQMHYNYLPAEALRHVSLKLNVDMSQVFNVATFYSSFSLDKRGRHIIRVCDGTACHLNGAGCLCEEIEAAIGVTDGRTTKDDAFTLEVVACLGACALAPVVTVDSQYHGKVTPEKLRDVLHRCRQGDDNKAVESGGRT